MAKTKRMYGGGYLPQDDPNMPFGLEEMKRRMGMGAPVPILAQRGMPNVGVPSMAAAGAPPMGPMQMPGAPGNPNLGLPPSGGGGIMPAAPDMLAMQRALTARQQGMLSTPGEYVRAGLLGAGLGASTGSGLGTAIGAGVGLLGGYLKNRSNNRRLAQPVAMAKGGMVDEQKKQVPKSQRNKPVNQPVRLAMGGAAKNYRGTPAKNLPNPLSGKPVVAGKKPVKMRGGGLAQRGMGFKGTF